MDKTFMNWSGGKDSALCFYKALQSNQYNIQCLLTNVNAIHNRISMHGVRRNLLEAQAASIGIALQTIELPEQPSMEEYEEMMMKKLFQLKSAGFNKAIFGDIFLEDLKNYRKQKLKQLDIDCIFPLWKKNTTELIKEFIALDFKAIAVCINENYLDKSFCGRLIDESFINDLPANVDVCGENGEFHSFVFDGPIFKQPLNFSKGEIVYKLYDAPKQNNDTSTKYGFYFCDLLPI
ncbi:MAG TPA: diphthine--ammonia ligase [Parafilimonas sp.]|nr:diphthine--ammonia ligase [Parafilimonas sp.]